MTDDDDVNEERMLDDQRVHARVSHVFHELMVAAIQLCDGDPGEALEAIIATSAGMARLMGVDATEPFATAIATYAGAQTLEDLAKHLPACPLCGGLMLYRTTPPDTRLKLEIGPATERKS